MTLMTPEVLILAAIGGGAVLVGLILRFMPESKPKEVFFHCTRCKAVSRHNERTIEAWRNNKTHFFCQACHAKWLQSKPPREREQFSSGGSGGSGCLGVVALFALLPMGCLLTWAYA